MTRDFEQRDEAGRLNGPPDRERVLRLYYAGEATPCPVGCGGEAEVVRVSGTDSGGSELWLECTSCAQRQHYEVPPATAAERRRAREALGEGREAVCARHSRPVVLLRRGRQRVCPACGILYRT